MKIVKKVGRITKNSAKFGVFSGKELEEIDPSSWQIVGAKGEMGIVHGDKYLLALTNIKDVWGLKDALAQLEQRMLTNL